MKNEEGNIFLSMLGIKKNDAKVEDNNEEQVMQGITSKVNDDEDYIEYWS